MTPSFRVAVVGPSRVGKTTLVTAVLSDTDALLADTPVTVSMDEQTEQRIRRQQRDLRRAIEVGEFDAAALGGTQSISRYHVALHSVGDASVRIPFDVLDYPGGWLDPEERAKNPGAAEEWPNYLDHVGQSIMLLVPIDAAVLMEAVTPRQKAAVGELLGLIDVERVALEWAKHRNLKPNEPAVVVLAPLKCEKYFGDNGGHGQDADRLRARVIEKYDDFLEIVSRETRNRRDMGRSVRVVYAPIDTYGCVELMEARWVGTPDGEIPEFTAHYRFRGHPPRMRVRAAGTVMQELCRAVLAGQSEVEAAKQQEQQQLYDSRVHRKAESKGFWGTIDYFLSGEARTINRTIEGSAGRIAKFSIRGQQLMDAAKKLAAVDYDPRVEIWSGEDG